jgi:hypothetical protein
VPWIILVASLPAIGYGFVNVISPRTTIAWQQRATARRPQRDPRARVGTAFQRWFGVDAGEPPSDDALRRIRLLGVAEVLASVLIVVAAFAVFS